MLQQGRKSIHRDLGVVHSIPGRIRLRAHKIRGEAERAQAVVQKLSSVHGVHKAEANPMTGSITLHYHHSALDSVEFFAEVAAALGMIAEGLDPSEVEALFEVLGASPAGVNQSLGQRDLVFPLAMFVIGFYVGRQFV